MFFKTRPNCLFSQRPAESAPACELGSTGPTFPDLMMDRLVFPGFNFRALFTVPHNTCVLRGPRRVSAILRNNAKAGL